MSTFFRTRHGKVSIIGNSGKIEVVNDVTLYKLQNEGDLTVTQGDLTVELTDHTSFINQDGAKIDVKEGTPNAATIAANAGEISAKQLGTIENRTSIQGNTGQIKAETAYLKVLMPEQLKLLTRHILMEQSILMMEEKETLHLPLKILL